MQTQVKDELEESKNGVSCICGTETEKNIVSSDLLHIGNNILFQALPENNLNEGKNQLEGEFIDTREKAKKSSPVDLKEQSAKNIKETEEKPDEILIQMTNYDCVTKDDIYLLRRVSLSLPKGKLVALIGMSGEGKTTLMNSLAGICAPSHTTYGKILVRTAESGLQERIVREWLPSVSYTQQHGIEYRNIPMYSLLCSVAKCYKKSTEEVDRIVSTLRLAKSIRVPFKNLSGGEQKRVMVACGLLAKNKFNIWDEPLSGLDSEMARITISMIKDTKATNLVSAHQISEDLIKRFDHVILMHRSTVVYAGPASCMKEHFLSMGIEFPSDTFYVNYIMQLCAENRSNALDGRNIEVFNRATQEIIKVRKGALREHNVWWNPDEMKVSYVRVLEIFRRLFYFDRAFKGASLIVDILMATVGGSIGVFIIYLILYSISPGDEINKYANVPSFDTVYKLLRIKAQIMERTPEDEDLIQSVCDVLKVVSNACWVHTIQVVYTPVATLLYILSISLPSPMIGVEFYNVCKANIKNKQLTVGDFLVAQALDVFVRKSLLIFIFKTALYIFLYRSLDVEIKSEITVNHTISIGLLFLSSLLTGAVSLMFNLAPIPQKLYGLGVFVYSLFTLIIPSQVYVYIRPMAHPVSFIQEIDIFRSENSHFIKNLMGRIGMSDKTHPVIFQIMHFIVKCMRFVLITSPSNYFTHLMQKINLYQNNLTMSPEQIRQFDKTDIRLAYEVHNLARQLFLTRNKINQEKLLFIEKIETAVNTVNLAHEIFNPDKLLRNISIAYIAKTMCMFWGFLSVSLAITVIYSYMHLQPKIRN
ncbi:hypothetical protein NEAUS07_1312 [Nematocida ausubeli]|nr:hypothetical protein NEAUS07_1312 [Nematocida ausubeli]